MGEKERESSIYSQERPATHLLEQQVYALTRRRDALFGVIAKLEKRIAYGAFPFLQTLDNKTGISRYATNVGAAIDWIHGRR